MKPIESALNWTGAVVIVVVTALCLINMLQASGAWQIRHSAAAALGISHLSLFLLYLAVPTKQEAAVRWLFWLQALTIGLIYGLVDVGYIAILGIVWTVQATERLPLGRAAAATTAMVLLFAGSRLLHPIDTLSSTISNIITLGLFHVFALVATYRFWREQQLRQQTAALNRELIATRELLSQQSRQYERLRISRDLHDLLGHHLTALILQLEVAGHHCEGDAEQRVQQALALAKLLISDLRTAVSELRESDALDLGAAVGKLVEGLPDLEVEVDFNEAPVVNQPVIAQALLRCIQESLTNVLRHSNADSCRIALTNLYNHYFLTVHDNGSDNTDIVAGNGLQGMRERVCGLGGDILWQQQEDGFLVQVKLPLEAET